MTILLKLFTLIAIVTVCAVTQAFSQSDYFITRSEDTVKCSFTFTSGQQTLRYKLPNQTETFKISGDLVKEYRDDGVIYVKRIAPDYAKPVFLQWIVKGKLNIYFMSIPTAYVNSNTYYGAIGKDMLVGIIKSSRMGNPPDKYNKLTFFSLIADSPEIVEMFDKENSYSLKTILRTIRNYNLYNLEDVFFVNTKEDTTRCKIIYDKYDKLLYRIPFAKSFEPLRTDSLKAYKLNGILYYRQKLPEKEEPQFIAHLIKGPIDLYADLENNVYVSKGGSTLTKIKSEDKVYDRKDILLELISDKPDLMKAFDKKKYSDINLLNVIMAYNGMLSEI